MLDGQCREMHIRHVVGAQTALADAASQHLAVPWGGRRQPYRVCVEPGLYLLPGVGDCLGFGEQARVGDQAHKGEQAHPGQTDAHRTGQLLLEPPPGTLVLRKGRHVGIDQQVRIDRDHR